MRLKRRVGAVFLAAVLWCISLRGTPPTATPHSVLIDSCLENPSQTHCEPKISPENFELPVWGDEGLVFLVAALSGRAVNPYSGRREKIRNSWAREFRSKSVEHEMPSRVVFIVGNNGCSYLVNSTGGDGSYCRAGSHRMQPSSDEERQQDMQLMEEQRLHRDIVFVDIEDTYQNSASKMLGFYRAILDSRISYEALIKMDDDGVILPTAFFETMVAPASDIDGIIRQPHMPSLRTQMNRGGPRWLGNFRSRQVAFTEIENERNKKASQWKGGINNRWKISSKIWPWPMYPSFAAGTLHIMNFRFASWLGLRADDLVKEVWMEDVAHGIWFDAAAAEISDSCRLFDDRFPMWPDNCNLRAVSVGSCEDPDTVDIIRDVYDVIELAIGQKLLPGYAEEIYSFCKQHDAIAEGGYLNVCNSQHLRDLITQAGPKHSDTRVVARTSENFTLALKRCLQLPNIYDYAGNYGGKAEVIRALPKSDRRASVRFGMASTPIGKEVIEWPVQICGVEGNMSWHGKRVGNTNFDDFSYWVDNDTYDIDSLPAQQRRRTLMYRKLKYVGLALLAIPALICVAVYSKNA